MKWPSKFFLSLSLFFFLWQNGSSELRANPWNLRHYERDWQKYGYTKFSDFIAKLKVHKEYRFVEDYIELYRFPLYYGEKDMLKNIANLNYALTRKFRSPYYALCKIQDEISYHKYRLLLFMHIHVLLTRNFLRIGAHFDKRHVHFHDAGYLDEMKKSFAIAELFYKESFKYWRQARSYAAKAARIPRDIDLGFIESERFDILKGELDLAKMANIYLYRLRQKVKRIEAMQERMKQNG